MLPTRVADILAAIDNDIPCPECHGAKRWKRKVRCGYCSGDGKDFDNRSACANCGGKGVLFNNSSADECAHCEGYGYVWGVCAYCKGQAYSYETCSCSTCQGNGNQDFAKTVLSEGDDLYIAGIAAHMYHYSTSDDADEIVTSAKLFFLLKGIKDSIENTFVTTKITEERFPAHLFEAGLASLKEKIRLLKDATATELGRKKMSDISENISEMAHRYSETRRLTDELNEKYPPESY